MEPSNQSDNPFDDVVKRMADARKQSIEQSMFVADGVNPDERAKAIDLSEKLGTTPELVATDIPSFEAEARKLAVEKYKDLGRTNPAVAKWLSDHNNAAISHDDVPNLKDLEDGARDYKQTKDISDSIYSSLARFNASLARIPGAVHGAASLPWNAVVSSFGRPDLEARTPDWLLDNPVAKFYDDLAEKYETPELRADIVDLLDAGDFRKAGRAFTHHVAAQIPNILAVLATGGGSRAMGVLGSLSAASAYKAGQESGVTQAQSTINALSHGTIEAVTERLGTIAGLEKISKKIAARVGQEGAKTFFKEFGKTIAWTAAGQGVTEFGEEAAATFAQSLSDYITGVDRTALDDIGKKALNAGIVGFGAGSMGTTPAAVALGAQKAARVRSAALARDMYLAMGKTVEASKLRARLPKKHSEFVKIAVKEGGIDTVYIDPKTLDVFFQKDGGDVSEALAKADLLKEYSEAKDAGTDMAVPIEKWADAMVTNGSFQELANDVKFSPDALTANEAIEVAKQEEASLEVEAKATDAMVEQAKNEAPVSYQASAKLVGESVAESLRQAGTVYSDADIAALSKEWGERYLVRGALRGVDPLELFVSEGYTITTAMPSQEVVNEDQNIYKQSLSTRVPSGAKSTEDPLTTLLVNSYDVMTSSGQALKRNVDLLSKTPNMRPPRGKGSKDTMVRLDEFITHAKDNIIFLYKNISPEQRDRAKEWYDGGNKIVKSWAKKYNLTEMQIAGVLAVLSPENAWQNNVTLAERVLDIVSTQLDHEWDSKMSDALNKRLDSLVSIDRAALEKAQGSTLGEVIDDPMAAALWVRFFDEAHNSRSFRDWTPEGGAIDYVRVGGGGPRSSYWKYSRDLAKAISIITDGRAENVSMQLGTNHKVRNFYNNLFDPKSEAPFVTIDTHAVAAALLRPLSSSDQEAVGAFGGAGSSSSKTLGLSGTYGIYHEAYVRAANELGIKPRELQSIAWEAVRGLFEQSKKSGLKTKVNEVWKSYKNGEISADEARARTFDIAGGITAPSWTSVPWSEEIKPSYDGASADAASSLVATEDVKPSEKTRIVFELAPDPTDKDLTAKWNALSKEEKDAATERAIAEITPQVLKEFGVEGDVEIGIGGYMGEVNPNITLTVDNPDAAVSVARAIGYIFDQHSVFILSGKKGRFLEGKTAVSIALPPGAGLNEIKSLYGILFAEGLAEGFLKVGNYIAIIGGSRISQDELNSSVFRALSGRYSTDSVSVFSALIEKEAYGYGGYAKPKKRGRTAGRPPAPQRGLDRLHVQAEAVLRDAIEGRRPRETEAGVRDLGDGVSRAGPPDLLLQSGPVDEIIQGFFDPKSKVIGLLKDANHSTFIHETGHAWLEEMGRDYEWVSGIVGPLTLAQEQFKTDAEAVLKWLGVESFADIKTEHHEKWAKGFEQYHLEGRAPNSRLASAFARFRVWMISIYRVIKGDLSDEIRGVMDRMIAAQSSFDDAKESYEVKPMAVDPGSMGMNTEQAMKYMDAVFYADEEAKAKFNAKVMADYEKARSSFAKQERSKFKEEVTAEVEAKPVYRLWGALNRGELPDGTKFKLSKSGVLAVVGDEAYQQLPRGITTTKDHGMDPSLVAPMFGFRDASEMLQTLAVAPKKDAVIQQETARRFEEKYPDLLKSAEIPKDVLKLLHNDARRDLQEMEMQILADQYNAVYKDVTRRVVRRVPRRTEVKAKASAMIAAKKFEDVRPHLYLRAEVAASKEAADAFAKGDIDGAFKAKLKEALNHELYFAAVDAVDSQEAALEKFKKLKQKDEKLSKTRDMDFINAARAILAQHGIGKADREPMSYLSEIKAYAPDTYLMIESLVQAGPKATGNFEELTVGDFKAMAEIVLSLWDLSKQTKQMQIEGEIRDRDDVAKELINRLLEVGLDVDKTRRTRAITDSEKLGMQVKATAASTRRVESWSDLMGPEFKRYIFNPISTAATRYRLAKAEKIKEYLAHVEKFNGIFTHAAIPAPELGYTFSNKNELLGALLHSGNGSNLSKLLRGNGWGELNEDGTLNRAKWDAFIQRAYATGVITKQDMDFVQGVWDLFESLKAGAQRTHKQVYGRYFSEITAEEIATPFGVYRGGYAPAIVDSYQDSKRATQEDIDALTQVANSFMFPSTGSGFAKSRIEQYAAPLKMDLRLIHSHIDKVLKFTIVEPHVRSVAKLVYSKEVKTALEATNPDIINSFLTPWLQRSATQVVITPPGDRGKVLADKVAKWLRAKSGAATMFVNVTNTLQQITGFTVAAVKVPWPAMAAAFSMYSKSPRKTAEVVASKSEFMRDRMTTNTMEVLHAAEEIALNPSKYDKFKSWASQHTYVLQSAAQGLVDITVWLAAYNVAVAKNGTSEIEAVRIADSAVRLTQGSMNPEDVSRIETGSAGWRLFMMFSGYFNMLANLMVTEIEAIRRDTGLRKGAGKLFYVYLMGFALPMFLGDVIVKGMAGAGFDEDDDDEWTDDIAASFFESQFKGGFAMVPVAGQLGNTFMNYLDDKPYNDKLSVSPVVTTLEATVRAPVSVYNAIFEDKSYSKAVKDTLTALTLMSGIPAAPLAKPVGYLFDVQEGKADPENVLDFGRGLITGKPGK